MILLGIPDRVQRFFAPVRDRLSRPIRNALPLMVVALLLAPSRRCLKTLGTITLGAATHASTISRRLRNPLWRTRDWFVSLYDDLSDHINRWERRHQRRARLNHRPHAVERRRWVIVIDTTYHETNSECMENLILINRRRRGYSRHTRHHAFVMGIMITETGFRLPLPRKSYYTQEYCQKHGRRHRTQVQLAAEMIREANVPEGVDVYVLYDSAFDANIIHQTSRQRNFFEVFPIDPNRNLSSGSTPDAPGIPGARVIHWTRTWGRDAFTLLELHDGNEDHVLMRRRHCDNLRLAKTFRRYAVAACHANVSHLGRCVIVASYKENPRVPVGGDQSADWWDYHTGPVCYNRHNRPQPRRWQGKVLACTDVSATARQVVEWYELRWQIEIYFRELKSRMQFGRYVLKSFAAVERYLDLLMMGMLLLEWERLQDLQAEPPAARSEAPEVHARTTDRLRSLEERLQEWNVEVLRCRMRSARGRHRLLRDLQRPPGHVA